MISLTKQDLHKQSPRCNDDCPRYEPEGCENDCQFRFRTVYKCPHCSTVGCYYGSNNPIHCPHCKRVLPDYWKLDRKEYPEEKFSYHTKG